ncbi:MAG: DUF1778 domain-containing protein [Acidobacteria bacterium]|nr:DUF1778 domain-containing protein [Acidobacteriota bacterium]
MDARREAKIERVELRATSRQTTIIKQAAEATGKTVTSFVLDAAFVEAQRALADRRTFRLDAERWARFVEALDRRVKPKPRLRRLIERPGAGDSA